VYSYEPASLYARELCAGDLPERAARLAKILGEEFHGCAQMTLKVLQEVFGLTDVEVFKAASPLSGGIARSGQTCGSLLRALLFIGVVFGRRRLERTDVSEDYRRAMEILREFTTSSRGSSGRLSARRYT